MSIQIFHLSFNLRVAVASAFRLSSWVVESLVEEFSIDGSQGYLVDLCNQLFAACKRHPE